MKLSVIMSNYNGGSYIMEAIESVVSQDYHPFEFIVIDDGSTDNSRDIIDAACNKYGSIIRKHYAGTNQGQGQCINYGVNNINGEVVCFIDSDDLWLPGKLQSVAEAFQRRPGAVIYQHNLFVMNGTHVTNKKVRDILVEGNYYDHAMKSRDLPVFVPTSGLAIRIDCLKKVLPIPAIFKVCADGYITRTSMCWGNVTSNSDCYGIYRVHQNNNTFGNNNFNERRYLRKILYPALDRYYANNDLALRFGRSFSPRSLTQRMLDTSLRKILSEYLGISV